MYKRLTLTLYTLFALAACGNEPNQIVIATPQTGDLYPVGNYLFNQIDQGVNKNSSLIITSSDSGCNEKKTEQLVNEVLANASDTKLVVGPLCYASWKATQPIFAKADIPQIPLTPTKDWESLIEHESRLLARFATEKMQSNNTMIAYTANQYGNVMAEKLRGMAGKNAYLFPLANLKQTSNIEAEKIIKADPSVLILVSEYPKAVHVLEALYMRGLNAVLLLTTATQPSLLIERFGVKRMALTRFAVAAENAEQLKNLQAIQANITLAQINYLAKDEITPSRLASLPTPPPLRLVRVDRRSGNLEFTLGMD